MRFFCVFFCFFRAKIWPAAAGTGELARDLRDQTQGACSHFTVHSRLALHRSKLQLLNAGSLELGKESLQYRLNVAQEENRSERVASLQRAAPLAWNSTCSTNR